MKNSKIRTFIDGHPSVIIKEGKVKFNVMSKLRYTLDDLISQLREKGVKSLEEVDYAVLETNGNLSVFQNTKNILTNHVDNFVVFIILPEQIKVTMLILTITKSSHIVEKSIHPDVDHVFRIGWDFNPPSEGCA